jgi:DNA polymerase elongation subunit (family B)
MYQNVYYSKKDEICYLWDDEKGFVSFPFKKYAYRKKTGGQFRSMYGDELEKTIHFDPRDPYIFEGDVPIETRILIDGYEKSDEPSKGHRVLIFDIEVSSEGGFPVIETADKEVTAISLYDKVTDQYYALIVDAERKINDEDKNNVFIRSFVNEESLLKAFLNKWEEIQPTIVSGWNIDYFDMPYIYNRLKVVLGETSAKRLSPINECYMNKFNKRMVIAGVSCLDYILLYKKFIGKNRPSYALGEIGKLEVKMEKIQYKGSLNHLYKEDIQKYVDYNLNDVVIVVALDKKFKYIELAREICHVGHVPYEWFHMSSRYLEGAILMDLRRNNLVAPNKPIGGSDELERKELEGEEGFEGAYVKRPTPGRYDWLYDLDLASMYPNIVITLNISPETKVGKVSSVELTEEGKSYLFEKLKNRYYELDEKDQRDIPCKDYINLYIQNFDSDCFSQNFISNVYLSGVKYTNEDFKKLLLEEKLAISSNGVIYATTEKGVIPKLLSSWFAQRKEMRKLSKKYHDEGNKELEEYYDRKQYTWKIMLNSMYGGLGLPVFRFYDVDNAAAVTITGVTIIQTTGKLINQYYRNICKTNEDYVVYQDTDSCFVSAVPIVKIRNPDMDLTAVESNESMVKSILEVASEVQTFVNKAYSVMAKKMFNVDVHTLEIKQEIISTTGFWLAKKRYAQWRINENGKYIKDDKHKLEVKGIDVVRTSFPIRFRSFLEEILKDILAKKDKEEIDNKILKFRSNLKNLSVIEIAKNTSVKFLSQDGKTSYDPKSRSPFSVVNGTPAQVKAALYYNDLLKKFDLQKNVEKIHSGTKIKWVYLKDNPYNIECLAFKADGTDPDKIMDIINLYVDKKGLYEHELKGKLLDFYNILSWEFPNNDAKKSSEFFT